VIFFFQVHLVTLTNFFGGVSHVPGPVNETKISLGMVTVTPPNELIVLVQYSPGLKLFSCCDLKELISTRTNQRISEETESD